MEIPTGAFYIGGKLDEKSGERTADAILYPSHDFTTHGVIVGMTGSGKTGLGMSILEEALLSGVPCLIIDPKGDMGNLLLNFPEFRAGDFRPWIDEAAAKREGVSPDDLAAKTAASWKEGLASWDITAERMRRLRDDIEVTIYTPGSGSGVPINVLGSLAAPTLSWGDHAETLRDEIEGFVSSLLTLAGVESDPVQSPEHILLATIVEQAWRAGKGLDLPGLIGQVQQPPFRKLGVFELDAFYPPKERTALAMRLNGLVASPSFTAWLEGTPLDIERLLYTTDGKARGAVLYLAHLSDSERQFVVTLLLAKVVTWMRGRSGTSDLAALIYMDELFGFCPPTAEPPSKKPILTILKQARAFGVGMLVSTQNPVDLDYKAMSNAGTWMVGRLQTERDKARVLEGMKSASGSVDVDSFDQRISGLGKRQFVLQTTKGGAPLLFSSRWAMSFLAGPLTREQVTRLRGAAATTAAPVGAATTAGAAAPVEAAAAVASSGADAAATATDGPTSTPPVPTAAEAVPVAPQVAAGVAVCYLDPAAAWGKQLGLGGEVIQPAAVATVHLRYDDTATGVDYSEDFEAVLFPLGPSFAADIVHPIDHDPRDFRPEPPSGAQYAIPGAELAKTAFWKALTTGLTQWLTAEKKATIYRNSTLKLYSRVGENRTDFEGRCAAAGENAADGEVAKLKDRYQARIERVKDQLAMAENRTRELETDVSGRRQHEMLAGAGDLLGAFLGGRRRSSGLGQAASRRRQTKSAEVKLSTAEAKVADKSGELEQLEAELADDLAEISARHEGIAGQIETVEIGLEKTDVSVEPLKLVWG